MLQRSLQADAAAARRAAVRSLDALRPAALRAAARTLPNRAQKMLRRSLQAEAAAARRAAVRSPGAFLNLPWIAPAGPLLSNRLGLPSGGRASGCFLATHRGSC